jgi:biopolymer transport protein TolR
MKFESGQGQKLTSLGEINVTPLVDVMLVLLIIFMVTAPMLDTRQGIEVENPRVTNTDTLNLGEEPLILQVDATGGVWFGKTPIKPEDISQKMGDLLKRRKDKNVYIDGDKKADYGTVIQVMANLRKAGVDSLGLITKPPEAEKPKEENRDRDTDKSKEKAGAKDRGR